MVQRLEEPDLLLPFDEYVQRFGKRVYDEGGNWFLESNALYYAQTAETISTRKGVRIWIATRSSSARNGLRVQFSDDKLDRGEEFEGKPFLVLHTYGTHIELPRNYRLCQMIVQPSRHLLAEEIKEAIHSGEIQLSGNPIVSHRTDSIVLTFHPKLLRYNGRTIHPKKDNKECFEEIDITHGYVLEPGRFYLGSTKEIIGIGRKHVGVLHETGIMPLDSYTTHFNAPYHWPGSDHSITLEISTPEPKVIKAGQPACLLHIQELYPECESPYDSRYNDQYGPVVSRGNLA